MKLDFNNMEVGSFPFNFVRNLMTVPTGGADVAECLKAAVIIKDNDLEGWAREWAVLADKAAEAAEQAMRSGDEKKARGAFLRASKYYQSSMFSLPSTDARLDKYIRLSRELFQNAAKLYSPPIEAVTIPFEGAKLPAYFMSAGPGKLPTLLVMNGGDSTNEEMVHWIGLTAIEKGWNCLVFEGPGQWSALQMNPGLYMRPDYEVPTKAVIDYLVGRNDVDPERIALIGYSLSSQLAARAVAFEKRICACICVGGIVVDVSEAWEAVMPSILRNALPGLFDRIFESLERSVPSLRSHVNHHGWSLGVSKPHEVLDAWKRFNIRGLAPQIQCPVLVLVGEGEYQQTDLKTMTSVLHFISELKVPVTFHEFAYTDGWAASHCSVGDEGPANAAIFDWLDRTVIKKETLPIAGYDWGLLKKYKHSGDMDKILQSLKISVI